MREIFWKPHIPPIAIQNAAINPATTEQITTTVIANPKNTDNGIAEAASCMPIKDYFRHKAPILISQKDNNSRFTQVHTQKKFHKAKKFEHTASHGLRIHHSLIPLYTLSLV